MGLTFATAGAATPVVVAGISISAGAVSAITAVGTGAGIILTIESAVASIVQAALNPVTFRGWYGVDDYSCKISGGLTFNQQGQDKAVITNAEKLSIEWANLTSKTSGTVTA